MGDHGDHDGDFGGKRPHVILCLQRRLRFAARTLRASSAGLTNHRWRVTLLGQFCEIVDDLKGIPVAMFPRRTVVESLFYACFDAGVLEKVCTRDAIWTAGQLAELR